MRGLLTAKRCDEIKKEILFMFEEAEVSSCPIDCFAIAEKLHYGLRPYSTLYGEELVDAMNIDPDGFSRVEIDPETGMNQYIIYYNDICVSIGRMRMTIFHEIGHIYLGHHDNPDDSLCLIEEAEAKFFAKYAIAPPPLIHALHCQTMWDVKDRFNTSEEASYNIYEYFQKWLVKGPAQYLDFEIDMIRLFTAA